MSSLYPVAGCKIYIGSTITVSSADKVVGDFTSQSWTEIDGWETMGAFGDVAALITTPIINRNRDNKSKGTANAGQMQNVFAQIVDDEGQIALIAAASPTDKNNYAFRIDLNDKPASGASPAPSKRYFAALVMSAQEQGGGANTNRNLSAMLEINSNIVSVAATTGS